MASTLCSIIGFEHLRLIKVYEVTYFKHVMSKVFEDAINETKFLKV
jgi:hypothetical protein